jgi:broad specificity phosphatase PhoE
LQLGVRYDCRLREIARGIRQGLPKHYTHEQAMKTYHSGIHPLYNIDNTMLQKQPLLESEDDGWNRMHTLWLMEIIRDVSSLHQNDSTNMKQCDHNHCHNVLVVTHGALLRVFLQRLFGHERLRERGDVTSKRNDDGNSSRLDIPNTSLTIIDIHINVHTSDVASVDVHCFANTEHYTLMNPKTHHVLDGN